MLEAPCLLRSAAIESLDRARIPWRMAFTSAGLAGVWAAVAAGLGVTLRTPLGLPASVRLLDAATMALPALAGLGLALHRAECEPTPAVERLASIVRQDLQGMLADAPVHPVTVPAPMARRGHRSG
jgi:DNA-binding transcriptional LysR family regulator